MKFELPDAELLQQIHTQMSMAAQKVQLVPGKSSWRGSSGNLAGSGTGSSIDFHDFRPYSYGDDPRYIDWKAYARSDQLVMKLYQEEIAPKVDLLIDLSSSMYFDVEKRKRVFELIYFVAESARVMGSSLRVQLFSGDVVIPLRNEELFGYAFPAMEPEEEEPRLPIPSAEWRYGSLRVVVSDLLFPGDPAMFLCPISSDKGRALIFSPFTAEEERPTWDGNLRFIEVEAREAREMHADRSLLDSYMKAYAEHFLLWKNESNRYGIDIVRFPSHGSFYDAVEYEAFPTGVVSL